jgi:glucokinase
LIWLSFAVTDLAVAVDIGGTKMAVGLVDRTGNLRHRAQVPTPHALPSAASPGTSSAPSGGAGVELEEAELLWRPLADLVRQVMAEVESGDHIVVCGVGCGGPMSPEGETVSPLNIVAWRQFPLRQRLHDLTGKPTFVDNDAKALALAEGWIGAAAGLRDFVAIVVSTGVGGGLVLDGRLLEGRLGNAGHIGHVVVVPEGRICPCGGKGCLEAEASGTAVAAITGHPAKEAPAQVIERTGTLVGRAVASVVNLLDLPLAVVSGSVALGFGAPFFEAAQREVELRCGLDYARGARVVPGGLGDEGPLIGAGSVGWRGLDALDASDAAV